MKGFILMADVEDKFHSALIVLKMTATKLFHISKHH